MTVTTSKPQTQNHRQRYKAMLLAGLCTLMTGWLLWLVVLPGIVEQVTVNALRNSGFHVQSLQVESIGLYSARVSDLRLQNGNLSVARIRVSYTPLSLLSGRVDHITVSGLRWQVTYRQGEFDLALPPELLNHDQTVSRSAEPSSQFSSLPINRITIRDAQLVMAYDKWKSPVLTLDSEIVTKEGGKLAQIMTQAHFLGLPVSVNGQVDLEQTTTAWTTRINLFEHGLEVIEQQLGAFDLAMDLNVPKSIGITLKTGPNQSFELELNGGEAGITAALTGDGLKLQWMLQTQTGLESGQWVWSVSSSIDAGVKTWQFGPLRLKGISLESRQLATNDQAIHTPNPTRFSMQRLELVGADDQPLAWIDDLNWPSESQPTVGFHFDTKIRANLAPLLNLPKELEPKLEADLYLDIRQGMASLSITGLASSKNIAADSPDKLDFKLDLQHNLNRNAAGETRLRLDIPAPMLGRWLEAMDLLQPTSVSGNIDLDLYAKIEDAWSLSTGGTARLGHLDLDDKKLGLSIGNLHGEIVLDSLLGPSTPPRQAILIDKLAYAGFVFLNNTALMTMRSFDDILFDRITVYPESGGRFLIHNFRFEPDQPVQSELYIERWNLIAFLEEVTDGKIRGHGLVYGRLPFEYTDGKLFFSTNTWVHGEPGGGEISILDQKMRSLIIEPLLKSDDPTTRIVAERLEEALGKMRYDFLQARLRPQENGSLTCQIEIRGRGVEGEQQEIGGLVVNLSNFGLLLNKVLLAPVSQRPTVEQLLQWVGREDRVKEPSKPGEGQDHERNPGEGELPAWMNEDGSMR